MVVLGVAVVVITVVVVVTIVDVLSPAPSGLNCRNAALLRRCDDCGGGFMLLWL